MWVFGYGSLLWKVDFPFEYKLIGYVKGFERRFYQSCTDHRGTPEHPGRVVTLIPRSDNIEATVWGIAYKIKDADKESVVKHLDYREKGGYQRVQTMFYPNDDTEQFEITLYLGTADNVLFAGETDLDSIAKQVVNSRGPSGSNMEYVCTLAKFMRDIAPNVNDEHLFGLEARLLELTK